MTWIVQAVLRKSASSPRWLRITLGPMPTSENIASPAMKMPTQSFDEAKRAFGEEKASQHKVARQTKQLRGSISQERPH